MTSIKDFTFIDQVRLESYFLQISEPDKILKKQKIPNWDVSMSLVGPKLGGKQTVSLREYTIYEKILKVEEYLKRNGMITSEVALIKPFTEKPELFCKGKIFASRAVISSKGKERIQGLDHLALWINEKSESVKGPVAIYLIEAVSESDRPYVQGYTGYSALDFLLSDIGDQTKTFRSSLIGNAVDSEANISHRDRFEKFATDPAHYLESLGAKLGPPKHIECLFRIRLVFMDFVRDRGMIGVIGYPIYISTK
jgi:hypothetical protein